METLFVAIAFFALGGLGALALGKREAPARAVGVAGALGGCALGLLPASKVAFGGPAETFRRTWDVPYGTLYLRLDALAAFFLVVTFLACGAAALYGSGYLRESKGRPAAASWFFFNLLILSMVGVFLAHNGLLFLFAWELMALSSFFLVTFEDEDEKVRRAGWIYLVASHIGTAFLLVLFLLLGRGSGSLDFDRTGLSQPGLLFVLAIVGFGAKAGFVPFHVWLPEAHPAAPSHVSAVMSGVMIKTGIYGVLRVLSLLGGPALWWGWTLCVIGISSGLIGVLFALVQHDLKRLLAYSSVENIGIIALGLGMGLIGVSEKMPMVAVAGFAGGILHVLNHALFKGLLFLGAGAVAKTTGTRDMDKLGGLLKRMPATGAAFLAGAAAICALPPLNGFVSEFLIYVGALAGVGKLKGASAVMALCVIGALALIGGLAAASFAKAFGIVFLGEPRSPHGSYGHEPDWTMRLPMLGMAAACASIGLLAPWLLQGMAPVVVEASGLSAASVHRALAQVGHSMLWVALAGALVLFLVGVLSALRHWLLPEGGRESGPTWGCGYATPDARMQYTSSSFTQPLAESFRPILLTRRLSIDPEGLFPEHASFRTHTPELFEQLVYRPAFRGIRGALSALRPIQHGNVQVYIVYIALTLVMLMVWELA